MTEVRSPATPARTAAGSDVDLELYRMMTQMRAFEKSSYDLFLRGLVKGTSHLGIGQEAVAAGFGAAMQPNDYTFATYRGHNHALARGVPMAAVMAELMGRAGGLMSGKGGSMHLTSVAHRMMGSYAIVGAHLTIANGAAWSSKIRGSGEVTVCFFGDGATNIGAFHEALNLAAIWRLPIVFVCENNLWAEYTPIGAVTAVPHPAADRSSAYGLERLLIDGNDVQEVFATATAARDRAGSGGGPSLVEAVTYRHGGHSRADPGKYRPAEEVEAWMRRDPVFAFRRHLEERGYSEEMLTEIDVSVQAAVEAAAKEAEASPPPQLSLVEANVFADGVTSWRR